MNNPILQSEGRMNQTLLPVITPELLEAFDLAQMDVEGFLKRIRIENPHIFYLMLMNAPNESFRNGMTILYYFLVKQLECNALNSEE